MKYREKLQNHQTSRHSKQLVTREEIVITVFSFSLFPPWHIQLHNIFLNQTSLKRQFYRLICCHHKILYFTAPVRPSWETLFFFWLIGGYNHGWLWWMTHPAYIHRISGLVHTPIALVFFAVFCLVDWSILTVSSSSRWNNLNLRYNDSTLSGDWLQLLDGECHYSRSLASGNHELK